MKLGRKSPSDPNPPDPQMNEALTWTSNRYLQVHFEELHLGIGELRQELAMQRHILEELRRIAVLQSQRTDVGAEDDSSGAPRHFHFSGKNN